MFLKEIDSYVEFWAPNAYDAGKLKDIFKEYGNILGNKVVVSDDGQMNEYGYIHFATEESAYSAVDNLNGCIVEGKTM